MRQMFVGNVCRLAGRAGILILTLSMVVGVIGGLSAANAQEAAPLIQIPSVSENPTTVTSLAYQGREKQAMTLWKAGRKPEAKAALYREATDAPPADAAAAKLRLGYMNLNTKNREEAKRLFTEIAEMPSGVNDLVKGEAAIRCANLQESRELKRVRLERIVSGEYKLSNYDTSEISLILGAMAHVDLDLQGSLAYHEAVAKSSANSIQQAQAKVEAAGLCLEMAQGRGKKPIPESERPAAFERTRVLCKEVMDMGEKAPESRRMVAELMNFETYMFEKDYDTAFQLGQEFIEQWGAHPAKYDKKSVRIFINTAKTQLALISYLGGHFDEAMALAKDLISNPPPSDEHYAIFDCSMYAAVIGDLIVAERSSMKSDVDFRAAETPAARRISTCFGRPCRPSAKSI